ncbi:MAG: T9SS type A sorting domain-containing protein [Saprospiraceae bacterium]|nr:T9SS type A sorting domain-containing protein [Saprospiraceae bacterium]
MKLVTKTLCILLLLMTMTVRGQVSITDADLLNLIGKSQVLEEDSSTVTLDVGSPGANQVWDHRNIEFINVSSINVSFESPAGNPFSNQFPAANLVQHLTTDLADGDQYLFYQVESDRFTGLGDAFNFIFEGMPFSQVDPGESLEAPLPLTMGAEWNSIVSDTFSESGLTLITYDSTINLVDGWGTLRLPLGDFDCLRVKSKSYCTSITSFGGNTMSDTESELTYVWISPDHFVLCTATNEDIDNENFTTSNFYSRVGSVTGSTSLRDQTVLKNVQAQIYPNPFFDILRIEVLLEQPQELRVEILDMNQRVVEVLQNGYLSQGRNTLNWNGQNNVSAASYFLRIATPDGTLVRPILKL